MKAKKKSIDTNGSVENVFFFRSPHKFGYDQFQFHRRSTKEDRWYSLNKNWTAFACRHMHCWRPAKNSFTPTGRHMQLLQHFRNPKPYRLQYLPVAHSKAITCVCCSAATYLRLTAWVTCLLHTQKQSRA